MSFVPGYSFASDVIWCFKEPLDNEEICPCRYRHLIVDLVVQSMPPICQIDADYYYYDYGNCLEEDETQDKPTEGFSIADSNKIRTLNAPTKEGEESEIRIYGQPNFRKPGVKQGSHIAHRPPLVKVAEETEYSVQEIGQSQGQTGQGSALSAIVPLTVSAAVFVMRVLH